MRAFLIDGKTDASVREVPTPEPGDGEVRLRMAYAGICGSDLHYYFDGANGAFVVREPLAPGHEVSGVVDLDPSGHFAAGTRVTVHPATFGEPRPGLENHPHLWPNGAYLGSASTWPHTQGGMSEYLIVRPDMIRVLPDALPLRRAALAEPLAVGLHAIAVAGGVEGGRVLVSGSGPIGLLLAAAALTSGAASVATTDVLPEPLGRAAALGVQVTYRVGSDAIEPESFDIAFECSGVPAATNACIGALRRAGTVVQVGMMAGGPQGIEIAPIVSKELQLRGTFRFHDEIDAAIALLTDNPWMEQVVTQDYPADRAIEAFEVARDSARSGKVLVDLWHDGTLT